MPRDDVLQDSRGSALGVAEGQLPSGATIGDAQYPGVANLEGHLRHAFRAAADDATRDGVHIWITSGWRSEQYQEQLFRQAASKYGSQAEAARWVARPGTSVHEAGEAVDIGPDLGAAWLSEHGAAYGLCQIYRNEPWHFELRPAAVADGCPTMYADPTHDPRLQK